MSKLFQSTNQRQSQELSLKPKMLQSLTMLALPVLELDSYLKNELMANPMLEIKDPSIEEDSPPEKKEEEVKETSETETDPEMQKTIEELKELSEVLDHWNEINQSGGNYAKLKEDEPKPLPAKEDIRAPFLNQVEKLKISDNEKDFAFELIDFTNSYGFLDEAFSIEKCAAEFKIHHTRIDYIHALVKGLSPKGITSKSIEECLLSQLTPAHLQDTVLINLIKNDFDDLIHRRYAKLQTKYLITEEQLLHYKDIVSKLDPKPGLRILETDSNYVTPDVIIKEYDNEFVVIVNDRFIPNISLSRRYLSILNQLKSDKEGISYVRNKIYSAKFLVKSMFMRTKTLERVLYSIMKHQKKFFNEDSRVMDPLTYSVIAEELQVNESTISRVVRGKYADTPFGLMALRDFFTTTAGKDQNFEAVSRQQVQLSIKEMVNKEDKRTPLSDEKIVGILRQRGIKVSRRVIAKYRDSLGILNSRLRRSND